MLVGLDRRCEHVLDAGPQGPLEQVGGELVGDEDGADLAAGGEQLLGRGQLDGVGERRAEHDHHGAAVEGGRRARRSRRTARRPAPSCIARRARTAWSESTTATRRVGRHRHRGRHRPWGWPSPGLPEKGRFTGTPFSPGCPAGPYGVSCAASRPGAVAAADRAAAGASGCVVLGDERQVEAAALLGRGDPLGGLGRHVEGDQTGVGRRRRAVGVGARSARRATAACVWPTARICTFWYR